MSESAYTPAPFAGAAVLPASTPSELETLEYMRLRLYQCLYDNLQGPDQQSRFLSEPQGRQHRVIVIDHKGLLSGDALTFVGFFGKRRRNADPSVLALVDNDLIEEMRYSPHMLSYSSMELSNGEWVNFVLMRSSEGLSHWSGGDRHTYAARTLAPSYYAAVRLHIGTLPQGLDCERPLCVQRVRHISFGHIAV